MRTVNAQLGYILFDPRATRSFIACKFVNKLKESKSKLEMRLAIITPLGEIVEVNDVYKGCRVLVKDYEFNADLIPLEIVNFDVILGMDQLSSHQATMNYYTKVITIRAADKEMVNFYG